MGIAHPHRPEICCRFTLLVINLSVMFKLTDSFMSLDGLKNEETAGRCRTICAGVKGKLRELKHQSRNLHGTLGGRVTEMGGGVACWSTFQTRQTSHAAIRSHEPMSKLPLLSTLCRF